MPSEFEEIMGLESGVFSDPYQIEFYDKESIQEIKNMVTHSLYSDIDTVKEHLAFLKNLAQKFQNCMGIEHGKDSVDELKKYTSEIKNLQNVLSSLRDRFSRAS